MNRIANIGLAVLAVVVLASAVYVITHNNAPSSSATGSVAAHETPVVRITDHSPSLGIDATSTVASTSAATSSGELTIAFLGDDWTTGAGASSKVKRFTTLLCKRLHAQEANFGADFTGYAKSSDTGGPYRTRVDAVAAANPQIVVVSGGRNDSSDDAATLAAQAKKLFAKLRQALPDAVLVAVAPFWGDSDLPPEMAALATAVEQGVTDAGGTYIDIEDPIHNHPEYMADEADPDDQGYAAIAAALEPKLAALLPR